MWKSVSVFSVAVLQGSEVDYMGHKVYLGLDYIYLENGDESIEVQKILPWFHGSDDLSSLTFHIEKPKDLENLKEHCNVRPQGCETRGNGNYLARSILLKNYPGSEATYYNSFHSENCKVYISEIGEEFGLTHKAFIDNFFENSCK